MGLVIGIIIIILGLLGTVVIFYANGMSDAPSQNSISIWPWLIGCLCVGGLLIFTHYHHISW